MNTRMNVIADSALSKVSRLTKAVGPIGLSSLLRIARFKLTSVKRAYRDLVSNQFRACLSNFDSGDGIRFEAQK